MIDGISAHTFTVRDLGGVPPGGPGAPGSSGEAKGFAETLKGLVKETDDLQKSADQTVEDFGKGKIDDVHQVMLSLTRADLSFRMMLEVRNKLVEAYTEVMRTHV